MGRRPARCSRRAARTALLAPICAVLNLLHRNVQRFRDGLVFKANRLCVSLNSRLESNNVEGPGVGFEARAPTRENIPHPTPYTLHPTTHTPHPAKTSVRRTASSVVASGWLPSTRWLVAGSVQMDDPRGTRDVTSRRMVGLVFKAHRRLYHSTQGLRVIRKKRRMVERCLCLLFALTSLLLLLYYSQA